GEARCLAARRRCESALWACMAAQGVQCNATVRRGAVRPRIPRVALTHGCWCAGAARLQTPLEPSAVAALLAREIEAYDGHGSGKLSLQQLTNVLRDGDLHLSWAQQQALAADAVVGADGMAAYTPLIPVLAQRIHAILVSQTDASEAR